LQTTFHAVPKRPKTTTKIDEKHRRNQKKDVPSNTERDKPTQPKHEKRDLIH
jgi:hypothetical protein